MSAAPIGVLVMAYGGPSSLDEVGGYLADIRAGRPTPRRVAELVRERYRKIGGRSPLREISERQAAALEERLGRGSFRCFAGMRHWAPWIEEVVGSMSEAGVERAVGIVLAPHYSAMNTERYFAKVAEGLDLYRARTEFVFVESYHDSPELIEVLASRLRDGLARFEAGEPVHVVFSAHSLPARTLAEGDPYDGQLKETARLVASRAGLSDADWSWAYQSAGQSSEPWLGPDLREHLGELASRGVRRVVSLPVGFVADHVEVLYDIDVEARARAAELGMRLVRPDSLNLDPRFIEALARAVLARARRAGWLPEAGGT